MSEPCVLVVLSAVRKESTKSENRWRVLGLSHQLTVLLQAQYFHSIKRKTQQRQQQQTQQMQLLTLSYDMATLQFVKQVATTISMGVFCCCVFEET